MTNGGSLTAGVRSIWIAAAATGVFAAAWLGCVISFRQSAELSVAIAAGVDAIALFLLALITTSNNQSSLSGTSESLRYT
jgi:hypothetical protein